MAINENEVASLVAKVLAEMTGKAPAPQSCKGAVNTNPAAAPAGIPKTAHVAVLTELKHFATWWIASRSCCSTARV